MCLRRLGLHWRCSSSLCANAGWSLAEQTADAGRRRGERSQALPRSQRSAHSLGRTSGTVRNARQRLRRSIYYFFGRSENLTRDQLQNTSRPCRTGRHSVLVIDVSTHRIFLMIVGRRRLREDSRILSQDAAHALRFHLKRSFVQTHSNQLCAGV